MGTNGASGCRTNYMGSTTSRVIKSSTIPVIAVKEKKSVHLSLIHIVMPIDLTKTSRQKIDWAVKLGKQYTILLSILSWNWTMMS